MAETGVVTVPPDAWRLRMESGAAAGGAAGATSCIREEGKGYGEVPGTGPREPDPGWPHPSAQRKNPPHPGWMQGVLDTGSSGRIRTYNPPVNSRMLYH